MPTIRAKQTEARTAAYRFRQNEAALRLQWVLVGPLPYELERLPVTRKHTQKVLPEDFIDDTIEGSRKILRLNTVGRNFGIK